MRFGRRSQHESTVDVTTFGFYLMTEKGLRVLGAFLRNYPAQRVAFVVGAKDHAVRNDYFAEIAARCAQLQIPFFEKAKPASVTCDYSFAVAWRWMIRNDPRLIVLHDSLLPRYRGFTPLPTALIKGESLVGVTAVLAEEEFDRGDIVGQRVAPISYPIKIQAAIDLLIGHYEELVVELCGRITDGLALPRQHQSESQATYSLWRDDEDYRINWRLDATYIKRFIDSLGTPYKGAFSMLDQRLVRVLDSEVVPDVNVEDRHPGKVLFIREGLPVVVCGQGLLKLTDVRDDTSGDSTLPLQKFRTRFT
jgi:methionyl-tRNA formyltransferase